jgi:4-hydroxy-3-methylbut-2-enyl diphosphate reductase IspH
MGQAAPGSVILVQSAAQAAAMPIDESASYGLVTQTTLSVMDAAQITAILRRRIARLHEPSKSNICYATTNRKGPSRLLLRDATQSSWLVDQTHQTRVGSSRSHVKPVGEKRFSLRVRTNWTRCS